VADDRMGMSYFRNCLLDMRLNTAGTKDTTTAADVLNLSSALVLSSILLKVYVHNCNI